MRLIDADALIRIFTRDEYERVRNDYHSGYNDGLLHAVVVADDQPTVDAVPVIRCRECKWNTAVEWVHCAMVGGMFGRTTDNYCSRAERKEHETD